MNTYPNSLSHSGQPLSAPLAYKSAFFLLLCLLVNDITHPSTLSTTPFSLPTLVTKLPIPLPYLSHHLLFLNFFNLLAPVSTLILLQISSTSLPSKSSYSTLHMKNRSEVCCFRNQHMRPCWSLQIHDPSLPPCTCNSGSTAKLAC